MGQGAKKGSKEAQCRQTEKEKGKSVTFDLTTKRNFKDQGNKSKGVIPKG